MRQVTAAVIVEGSKLLIARRAPGERLAGFWELPGGKLEPGETPQECLRRELREELAMTAEVGELVATTIYHYDHGSFEVLAVETRRTSGFVLMVHDAIKLVDRRQLEGVCLAPADIELVRQLKQLGKF